MKLYRVENEYSREDLGRLLTYCLVIADTEQKAIEIARPKFKKYYDENISDNGEEDSYYSHDYFNKLKAIEIFSETEKEQSYFIYDTKDNEEEKKYR